MYQPTAPNREILGVVGICLGIAGLIFMWSLWMIGTVIPWLPGWVVYALAFADTVYAVAAMVDGAITEYKNPGTWTGGAR